MNLVVYIDRYVPSATKELYKEDLSLSDAESSLPLSVFIVVYMVASPLFGTLADAGVNRRLLLIVGIVLWSLATAAGALATGFWTFLLARALVGVGEAAYATITPALLADLYAPENLPSAMARFNVGLPVGAALGFAVGGSIGHRFGWRIAFLVCGIPGLLLASSIWKIKDPGRGYFDSEPRRRDEEEMGMISGSADGGDAVDGGGGGSGGRKRKVRLRTTNPTVGLLALEQVPNDSSDSGSDHDDVDDDDDDDSDQELGLLGGQEASVPLIGWVPALLFLVRNPRYVLTALGQTALTFGAGGLADWVPSFLYRYHGLNLEVAGLIVGAITVISGILGTLMGAGLAGGRVGRMTKNPNLGIPGLSMIPAAVGLFMALVTPSLGWVIFFIASAQLFLWVFQGPTNSEIANSCPTLLRTRAFAVSIFFSHALGDAASPPIIGAISDAQGSLRTALLLVPAALGLAGVFWVGGWRGLR